MPIHLHRHEVTLMPDSARVIIRPFIPSDPDRIKAVLGRAMAMTEKQVSLELAAVHREFEARHYDIEALLLDHFAKVQPHIVSEKTLSRKRQLLVGALFSGE